MFNSLFSGLCCNGNLSSGLRCSVSGVRGGRSARWVSHSPWSRPMWGSEEGHLSEGVWGRQMASYPREWGGRAPAAGPAPPTSPGAVALVPAQRLGTARHSGPLLDFPTWNPLSLGRLLAPHPPQSCSEGHPSPARWLLSWGLCLMARGTPAAPPRTCLRKGPPRVC